jgi:hypothetical protein
MSESMAATRACERGVDLRGYVEPSFRGCASM